MSLLIGPMLLLGLGVACSTMLLFWLIFLWVRNGSLLEVGRVLGVVLLSGLYAWMGAGWKPRKEILFFMIFLWGCRLTVFLLTARIIHRPEEGRYQRLREAWKSKQAQNFLYLFQAQATGVVFFAIPVLLVSLNKNEGITLLEMAGFTLWCAAFFGEVFADSQLYFFRIRRGSARKTCREGLWKYSRHPNYFFEFLVWCGIALFCLASPMGWGALICPAFMYYLLTQVTGIPVTEAEALKTRGASYRNYQKTTSAFFLRFKR